MDEFQAFSGTVLDGRYEVREMLGHGGMGAVYRGVQISVGRPVAIKVLRSGVFSNDETKARFQREAQVMAGLEHPNIVRLYDFGVHEQRVYMVMELIDGSSLHDLMRGFRVEETLALEMIRQAAAGMAEAHARGIVHRDLKPANLMMVGDSSGAMRVVVLDFGLARPSRSDVRLTTAGLVYGTPEYIAPEYARGAEFDQRAEMYALGVVLYELITGWPPFKGEPLQILFQQVSEPVPSLETAVSQGLISRSCEKLVMGMLAKDADKRQPQTMLELVHLLESQGIGRRRSVNEVMKGLFPKLELAKAHRSLSPSNIREGSTPFQGVDEDVKGAWQKYMGVDSPGIGEPRGVIDPNLDGSSEFLGSVSAASNFAQQSIPRDVMPTVLTVPTSQVDQSAEMRRIDTAQLQAVGMRPIENTIPIPAVSGPTPEVASPVTPVRTAPNVNDSASMLAFDPAERFAAERQAKQNSVPKAKKPVLTYQFFILIGMVVIFLLIALILQGRNFAPEADTLSPEQLKKHLEESAEESEEKPKGKNQ